MHFKSLADWMRAPGGRQLDTQVFGLQQRIAVLERKFVALRRERRFDDLYQDYLEARQSGKTHKRWISERSSTSRRSHVHAHGQVALIDEPFMVDGERLFLPSDPSGSFAQTANCGCTVEYFRTIEPRVTLVQARPPRRRGPGGRPLSPAETLRVLEEQTIMQRIRELDPRQTFIGPQNQVINETGLTTLRRTLARLERENAPIRTDTEARAVAAELGYRPVAARSPADAKVFTNGRFFISRDRDGHILRGWKKSRSIQTLNDPKKRLGTYNRLLTRRLGD